MSEQQLPASLAIELEQVEIHGVAEAQCSSLQASVAAYPAEMHAYGQPEDGDEIDSEIRSRA